LPLAQLSLAKNILTEDFSALTKHEDALLDKFYSNYGLGLFPHGTNSKPIITPLSKGIRKIIKPINKSVRKGLKLYKQFIIPMINKHFPALHQDKNKAYRYFLKKSFGEVLRNIVFADLSAQMHNSKVPDEANVYFAASHPYYDAIFDIDWKDAKGVYSRLDLVKRVSQVIQRDYNLPEPILPIEKMVIEITKGLERSLPPQNVETFFDELYKLNVAQIESVKQQMVKNISMDALRRTTFKKGGLSMTLYALLADHDFTRHELDIFFLEGAFLQNLDDMNDIYEDAEEGGITLAGSFLITPYELDKMTEVWFAMLDELVDDGLYDAKNVKRYKIAIDQFINFSSKAFNKYYKKEKNSKRSRAKRVSKKVRKKVFKVLRTPFSALLKLSFKGLKYPVPALRLNMN